MGNGVTDRRAVNVLNTSHHKAHFASPQHIGFRAFGGENTNAIGNMCLADAFGDDLVTTAQGALFNPNQGDNAQISVKPGVNNQGLQGGIDITFRRWNFGHQLFQNIFNAKATFGTAVHRVRGVDADNIFNFLADPLWLRLGQIHFVQYRNHFEALGNCRITVGYRLRFNALRRINHQ